MIVTILRVYACNAKQTYFFLYRQGRTPSGRVANYKKKYDWFTLHQGTHPLCAYRIKEIKTASPYLGRRIYCGARVAAPRSQRAGGNRMSFPLTYLTQRKTAPHH